MSFHMHALPSWQLAEKNGHGTVIIGGNRTVPLRSVEIAFYELEVTPMLQQTSPKAFPPGYRLQEVSVAGLSFLHGSHLPQISVDQFAALYNAVAINASWWPMTSNLAWNWPELPSSLIIHVLYDPKGMPCGFSFLEPYLDDGEHGKMEKEGKKARGCPCEQIWKESCIKEVKLYYIGLIRSAQGQGLGSSLLLHTLRIAASYQPQKITLDTIEAADRLPSFNIPASTWYKSHGFVLTHTRKCTILDGDVDFNQIPLPEYWEETTVARVEGILASTFLQDKEVA